MWRRKDIKRAARRPLKKNYLRCLVMCLLLAVFAGQFVDMLTLVRQVDQAVVSEDSIGSYLHVENTEDILNLVTGGGFEEIKGAAKDAKLIEDDREVTPGEEKRTNVRHAATRGVLASIVNNAMDSDSFVFGIINLVAEGINSSTLELVLMLIGVLISLLYWFFVSNILEVGACRFFLENRIYEKSPMTRIMFLYNVRREWNVAKAMLRKTIIQTLWSLTIVMYPVKHYQYMMVPYLLAENPSMTGKEAMTLSRTMTHGHKWELFKVDLSMIGWNILSAATIGVSQLWSAPYICSIRAELYMALRTQAVERKLSGYELMNDIYLAAEPEDVPEGMCVDPELRMIEYPISLFTVPEKEKRQWLDVDYNRTYSIRSLILMFFAFAFIGWIWEVSLHLVSDHEFVNRGVLHGPWLPIYGSGGVLIVIFLRRFMKRPGVTFALTVTLCGFVEYFTSWYLEVTKGQKWWDYSGYLLNLNGRICAEGLLIFGLGGLAILYFAAPALDNLFKKIPKGISIVVCTVLVAVFGVDMIYSKDHPNTGKGITDYGETEETTEDVETTETLETTENLETTEVGETVGVIDAANATVAIETTATTVVAGQYVGVSRVNVG